MLTAPGAHGARWAGWWVSDPICGSTNKQEIHLFQKVCLFKQSLKTKVDPGEELLSGVYTPILPKFKFKV